MSERDYRLYCSDILDSGSAILEFVKGLSDDLPALMNAVREIVPDESDGNK